MSFIYQTKYQTKGKMDNNLAGTNQNNKNGKYFRVSIYVIHGTELIGDAIIALSIKPNNINKTRSGCLPCHYKYYVDVNK